MYNVAESLDNANAVNSNTNSDINPLLPKMRGFKIASLNITSLVKHIEELRIFLADNMIDVLAINETRLDSAVSGRRGRWCLFLYTKLH
jgi:hypothetical protein